MYEEGNSQYLNLINALLSCPSGEESEILNANRELVDKGLVEVIAQVVEVVDKD